MLKGRSSLRRWFDVGGTPEKDLDERIARVSEAFLRSEKPERTMDDADLAKSFGYFDIPEEGVGLENYFSLLGRVIEHSIRVSSPSFIGHMTSALPYFVRPISRLLTALNQNLVKVETAKTLTPYEREALAMMHRLAFGCSEEFYSAHIQDSSSTLGIATSGGTLANITGLWIARNRTLRNDHGSVDVAGMRAAERLAPGRPVIIGSRLMHYSLEKAVDLLGIGTDGFIRVPVDGENRVRIADVQDAIRGCRDRGDRLIALIGIAGTTDAGSIDPLDELADLAKEAGCHFHVDAAWGGPLLFSNKYRDRLRGIERADSVTIDGHKQLYLPMGLGLVLLRDPRAAKAIEKQAQYIIRDGSPDLGRRALEGSRPGMTLYLHAGLHLLGREGYGRLVDEGLGKGHDVCKPGTRGGPSSSSSRNLK